jgi:hypothetical protein
VKGERGWEIGIMRLAGKADSCTLRCFWKSLCKGWG